MIQPTVRALCRFAYLQNGASKNSATETARLKMAKLQKSAAQN